MPFKKGKKYHKRKGKISNDSVTKPKPAQHVSILGKGLAFFPQSVTTVHKYCDSLNINNVGGILYNQVYRMNSMHDPDITNSGTNHQPMGRDQMITFYNRYRVDKFTYKLTYVPTTSNVRGIIGVTCLNSATNLSTTPTEIMEQPFSKYRVSEYTASARGSLVLTGTVYPHNVVGVTREKYRSDDVYQSVYSTSPAEEINFAIQVGDLLNGSAINHIVSCEFHYTVTWFDPLQMTQS